MKYSRNRINNAGAIIASDQSDILDYAESMNVIDDWRKLHLPVLEMLMDQLNAALAREGIRPAFSSQRLKRMQSIRQKLQRNPGMGLGGMQDIGGARLVFDDIPSLMQAKNCILNARFEGLEPDYQVYDYVQTPKESGYRSIHFVYKLSTLVELVRVTKEQSYTAGYALLLTDTNNKRVSVRYFQPHEKDLANDLYAQVESRLSQDGPAVVLVAVNDINELRNAYPSYFLNAHDFTSALHNFTLQCRVHGYL